MDDLVEVTVKTGTFNQVVEGSRRRVRHSPGGKPFMVKSAIQKKFKDVLQLTSDLAEPEAATAVDESKQLDEAEKREAARRAMQAEDEKTEDDTDQPEPETAAVSEPEDKKKESVTNEPNKAKGRKRPTRN